MTQVIFLSFMLLIKFVNFEQAPLPLYIISINSIANFLVFLFAPVDNPNKPMNKNEKRKYQKQSRIFAVSSFFVINLISFFTIKCIYFSLGIFSVAILLILGKVKNKKLKTERSETNEQIK